VGYPPTRTYARRRFNYDELLRYAMGRTSTFLLKDMKGQIRTKVYGKERGANPNYLKHSSPEFPPGCPAYEVITVNGLTEIIEHRKMEPIFYITDDPAVWKELGVQQKMWNQHNLHLRAEERLANATKDGTYTDTPNPYQLIRFILGTKSKCRSRLNNDREYWRQRAAIQMSLVGIGVPFRFNSRVISA
jgi:hypothetical protein